MKVKSVLLAIGALVVVGLFAESAFGIGYQSNVGVEFTFNPSLSITTPLEAISISGLTANSIGNSNMITVTVDTNNITGYTLGVAAGDGTTYTDNTLINTSAVDSVPFSSITVGTDAVTSFDAGKWGYTLDGVNYYGIPYYSQGYATINSTADGSGTAASGYTGTNSTSFGIGARASVGQVIGSYTNVIQFQVVANPAPMMISDVETMQEFSALTGLDKTQVLASMSTGVAYQLTDARDSESYYVAKLADGNVWMLDNLRLGGDTTINLTPSNTNIASNFTLPASSDTCFMNYVNCDSSGDNSHTGYTVAAINTSNKNEVATVKYGDGSGLIGVYYNYCAATAGTVCSESNSTNSQYDICPSGWRMPAGGSGAGEYYRLFNTSYSGNVSDFQRAFSVLLGGQFKNGSVGNGGSYGYFWSSTQGGDIYRYDLGATTSAIYPESYAERYYGMSVRCMYSAS